MMICYIDVLTQYARATMSIKGIKLLPPKISQVLKTSSVKQRIAALVNIAAFAMQSRTHIHRPIPLAGYGIGLCSRFISLNRSTLISHKLFIKARNGAIGKPTAKRVIKPNWIISSR